MTAAIKKTPLLRFEEFDQPFNYKILNDIAEVTRLAGYEYSKYWVEDENQEIIALRGYNVGKGSLDLKDLGFISNELSMQLKRSRLSKGDIVYPCVGSIGNAAVIDEDNKYHIQQNIAKISCNDGIVPQYISQFLMSHLGRREILRFNATSSQPNVLVGSLRQFRIYIPSQFEQQKIANFLTAVDTKLEQLASKKTLLEQYKKGVMQQIFTYSKRLGNSELRRGSLKDFGYFYYGKGAPKSTVQPEGQTPCVRYGELYSTYNEKIDKIESYTTVDPSKLKLSKGGEVLVPRVGEDPLDFANCSYLPFKDVAIGEMISVYNTEENGLYITYYINAMLKKELARHVEGGNVSNLYFRYVEEIEIEIPNEEEQEEVVNFLSAIDTKIAFVDTQIDGTMNFKKGLLQQMFV